MNWFPWVSRELLNEAKAVRDLRIAALEKQVTQFEQDRKRLMDFIAVHTEPGLSIFGTIEIPRTEEEPDELEPRQTISDDGTVQTPPAQPLVGRARNVARRVEAENIQQKIKDDEVIRNLINSAKEEGRRAAVTPTNGNGTK